jgi:hypothetical protein
MSHSGALRVQQRDLFPLGERQIVAVSRAGPKGDIPPRCRNHRVPAADDTPTAAAASSLVSPRATSTKNRFDGRIDERATG